MVQCYICTHDYAVVFILKILEKLLDRHIRGGVLVEKPLHQNQFAYRAGMSTETALFQVVQRLEKCLEHKEIALGAFLNIEGAFDNTSFKTIITTAKERGLEETCCRWIRSMLGCRLVHVSLMGLPKLRVDVRRVQFCLHYCGT
jgi:hypothetical protein